MSGTMNGVSTDDGALSTELEDGETEAETMGVETSPQERTETEAETETESEPEGSASLPLDQVFGILKNQRRRYVLKYLYESDGQVSLSEVAEQIAAWENDKEVRQISSSERKRVYVGLYQCHLPKMDGVDVISFNKPRGIIELGENADAVYKYLDTDDESEEPPWHEYSVALSLGGAAALIMAVLLRPMTALPVLDAAVASTILAFSVYSLANINWQRANGDEDDTDE